MDMRRDNWLMIDRYHRYPCPSPHLHKSGTLRDWVMWPSFLTTSCENTLESVLVPFHAMPCQFIEERRHTHKERERNTERALSWQGDISFVVKEFPAIDYSVHALVNNYGFQVLKQTLYKAPKYLIDRQTSSESSHTSAGSWLGGSGSLDRCRRRHGQPLRLIVLPRPFLCATLLHELGSCPFGRLAIISWVSEWVSVFRYSVGHVGESRENGRDFYAVMLLWIRDL